MQRMTDVLSRMLNDPSSRASAQRTTSESESSQSQLVPDATADEEGNNTEGGGGDDTGGGGQSQSSAVLGICLASSSSHPIETPNTVADECTDRDQLLTTSQDTTTHQSEDLGSETNCDESEVNTSTMQMEQTSTLCQPASFEPPQESESRSDENPVMEETENVGPVVEGMNHENEEGPSRNTSNIEGLQDRITSLTRGFVEKYVCPYSI